MWSHLNQISGIGTEAGVAPWVASVGGAGEMPSLSRCRAATCNAGKIRLNQDFFPGETFFEVPCLLRRERRLATREQAMLDTVTHSEPAIIKPLPSEEGTSYNLESPFI